MKKRISSKPLSSLLAIATILMTLLAASACSGKKPPSQAAIQGKNVLTSLREITEAYEKKDLGAFLDKFSRDLPDRQGFTQSATAAFAKFDAIRFAVQYTKMLIVIDERGGTRATFNWDGEWRTAAGRVVKDGSRVTFLFDPKGARVMAIEGRNPFVPVEGQAKQ